MNYAIIYHITSIQKIPCYSTRILLSVAVDSSRASLKLLLRNPYGPLLMSDEEAQKTAKEHRGRLPQDAPRPARSSLLDLESQSPLLRGSKHHINIRILLVLYGIWYSIVWYNVKFKMRILHIGSKTPDKGDSRSH